MPQHNSLFCVFLNQTDGCSYSSESLFGIFDTQDEAETALLEHFEKVTALKALLETNHKAIQKAHAVKDFDTVRRLALEWQTFIREQDPSYGIPFEEGLDSYEIRQVTSGLIPLCGV